MEKSLTQELNFVKIYIEPLRVALISDASFANAGGLESQLWYVILMADNVRCANIVHYVSNRCHRLTRSVMAAEGYVLIYAVDVGALIRDVLNEHLGRDIDMESYVDSRTLFNIVTKSSKTAKRCL